jgi:hypothetical protein
MMHPDTRHLFGRLSGLPWSVLEPFSTVLPKAVEDLDGAELELAAARAELTDALYGAIHEAPPEKRRVLLAAKRDCYNGRPLAPHWTKAQLYLESEPAGTLFARAAALENAAMALRRDFESAFQTSLASGIESLVSFLDDPMLRCGLAVGSPVFAREAERFRKLEPGERLRSNKKLPSTLLRYVSRAALKLSPFSTFTAVGLCRVENGADALRLAGGEWSRASIVRVRRHILDRCADLLLTSRQFRELLPVGINLSAMWPGDGTVMFWRPGRFRAGAESRKLDYQPHTLITARISGGIIERIRQTLAEGPVPYRDLIAALVSGSRQEAPGMAISESVDKLIETGFLAVSLPWSETDGRLEKTMLQALMPWMSRVPAMPDFAASLDRLVALEDGFLESPDPIAAYLEMHALLDALLEAASRVAQTPPTVDVVARSTERDIYQDVWCSPARDGRAPLMRVGVSHLAKALAGIEPLYRYSALFDYRLDFQWNLGALLRNGATGPFTVPLLQACHAAGALPRDYSNFKEQNTNASVGIRSFNPMHLPVLDELASQRESAMREFESCFRDSQSGREIDIAALDSLLRRVPARFRRGYTGACALLQPVTPDCSQWVQNGVKEGTGRCASRFTSIMPVQVRAPYVAGMVRRSQVDLDGEPVQLLDLYCPGGDTLNVHEPQTARALALARIDPATPEERQLALSDLFVTVDEDGWPRICDRHRQRYLPVHLGLSMLRYVPSLIRFLCAFGPSESELITLPALRREAKGVATLDRIAIGTVVVKRKSWRIPSQILRDILDSPGEPDVFAKLCRFRTANKIPDRVFALERVRHPVQGWYQKPQYLDLTSPLFVRLLAAVAASAEEEVTLVEMLPLPEALPRDEQGRPWAVELTVDAVSLREAENNFQVTDFADGVPGNITLSDGPPPLGANPTDGYCCEAS